MFNSPEVTIIIPTYNRPLLLPRAVKSALESVASGNVEVIIVPNGGDASWRASLAQYQTDSRIKISELRTANVNLARNHGLDLARGDLVRFLDDDDFLYPAIAQLQQEQLQAEGLDLLTYGVSIQDQRGKSHGVAHPKLHTDFGSAVLDTHLMALPFATVFRRSIIQGRVQWHPEVRIPEDEEWLREVFLQNPTARWACVPQVVGVWYQHNSPQRLSLPVANLSYYQNKANSIWHCMKMMQQSDMLTPSRADAATRGLWQCIHGAFFMAPRYWSEFHEKMEALGLRGRPQSPLFQALPSCFPVLWLECLMLPKRWLNHLFRLTKSRWLGEHTRQLS